MDTQTQIERLIELAIVQRTELKQLVEQLPQLREHLNAEIERNLEEIEPQLRSELEEFCIKRAQDEHAKLGQELAAKVESMLGAVIDKTQIRYAALIEERAKNVELAKQAEAKIAEAAAALPDQVKGLVEVELARFPRAGEIDQLRKEFAEPRGLNPRGKWATGETYNRLDLVSFNGDSFVSSVDGNTEKPSRNGGAWTLSAARGGYGGGGGITSLIDLYNKPDAGQVLIGNGRDYQNANLTAGDGISITNGPGAITIAANGGVNYQGTWNASTNTPALTSSVGTKGYYYVVSVAGSTNLNGITDWEVGDWAVFNGSVWQKIDNTDKVSAVFGRTGAVSAVSTDYSSVGLTNTAIGATNPSTGAFTTLSATGNLTVNGTTTTISTGNATLSLGNFSSGTRSNAALRTDSVGDLDISSGSGGIISLGYDVRTRVDSYIPVNALGGFYVSGSAISPNNTACIDMSFQTTYGKISAINRGVGNFPLALNVEGGSVLVGTSIDSGQKFQVSGNAAVTTANIETVLSLTSGSAASSNRILRLLTSGTNITNSGFTLESSATAAGSRNWGFATNFAAYGDYVMFQSAANGGNPMSGGINAFYLSPSLNLLLGNTTTDSGNGRLQLATHTTSAGGIGFGTDVSLYRAAAQSLNLDGSSSPQLSLSVSGTQKARFEAYSDDLYVSTLTAGKSIILRSGNATTALTLDSSQNATFAGQVKTNYSSSGDYSFFNAATSGANRLFMLLGIAGVTNGFTVRWNHSTSSMRVNIQNIPTSSTGLTTGDLWSDGGTIKIV